MPTTDPAPDDPVAARIDALRSALARPADRDHPGGDPPPADLRPADPRRAPGSAHPPEESGDELGDRLRARRSAAHVAAAYSAAHGHPWHDDEPGRRRWSLAGTTAVAAAGVLLAVALVVVLLAWPGGQVTDLGVAVSSAGGGDGGEDAPAGTGGATPSAATPTTVAAEGDGEALEAAAGPAAGSPAAVDVVVHVVGEVAEPGLVTLPAGSRVADAVEAAGGATDDAELAAVNLARDVVDGEQVLVPAPGQAVPAAAPPEGTGAESTGPAPGAAGPVPLNTADVTMLMELPGVGPVLAESIIAWRDENGPFTDVAELDEVSGIGPVMLAELRDLVVV